jgi:hypothetical protein
MSTAEQRQKALDFAICALPSTGDWKEIAVAALNFLETGTFTPGVGYAPSVPPPETPAPKVTRSRKPTAAPATPEATAAADASAAPASTAAAVSTPAAASTPAPVNTAPNKAPTLDDVRNALVQCQTRKGGKDVPQAILNKYSPSKTTGGLKASDYQLVINECASA